MIALGGAGEGNVSQLLVASGVAGACALLGKTINEMVLAAYPDQLGVDPAPAAPVTLHPLASELSRILADDSPISSEDRQALANVLDRLLDPYRRQFRRRTSA